jgi:hypothetical protein
VNGAYHESMDAAKIDALIANRVKGAAWSRNEPAGD